MAAPVDVVETKVVSASLFKNGYAVVLREAPLGGRDEVFVQGLPQASLGTLWLTASEGVTLKDVVYVQRETETEANAQSLDEILRANVGRDVSLQLSGKPGPWGTILSVDGNIVVLKEKVPYLGDVLQIRAVQRSSITGVSATTEQGELIWKLKRKKRSPAIHVRAEGPADAKLFILSLERGITWSPSYALDISDDETLTISGKAIIINDLADLDGIEVRLITGFPNILYRAAAEPLTSGQSVDQFVQALLSVSRQAGLGGMPGAALAQNVARSADFGAPFRPSGLPGLEAEDLFFYRQPDVRLKKGERGYFFLFQSESNYEHVYTWDVADPMAASERYTGMPETRGDVWHSLKFENNSEQPWTTAPAITVKNGEILGQDMLSYTSKEAEALVRITKALGVEAEVFEEETGRKLNELAPRGYGSYDLVTIKGTMRVLNRKSDNIKLKITRTLTGELISADGDPEVKKIVQGIRRVNPRSRLVWELPLKAGEAVSVTYHYKVYVRR